MNIRDIHVTERNGLLWSCQSSLIAVIFFFLTSFVMFLFCPFIFRDDTGLILLNLVFKNLILHIFLIIMIIIPCSGMFRNIPCSWFYRRPSCRWVESNFAAGFKNSFALGTKIVFFVGLTFRSSFRDIRIATAWNSISLSYTVQQCDTSLFFSSPHFISIYSDKYTPINNRSPITPSLLKLINYTKRVSQTSRITGHRVSCTRSTHF